MTLAIFVDNPSAQPEDMDARFIRPAGFEEYREKLWGTQSICKRAPMLCEIQNDLYIEPEQFDEFARQCYVVRRNLKKIAEELAQNDPAPITYGISFRKRDPRRVRVGWQWSIRGYINNFLEGVEFAKNHDSPQIYIG